MTNLMTRVAYLAGTANPSDGGTYSDGDVIGGLITFEAIPGASGAAILNAIYLADDDGEGSALDLFLFNAAPTTIADDAAYAPVAADHASKLIYKCAIAAADYATENSLKFAIKEDINLVMHGDGANKVYGYLVANGSAPSYAANKTLVVRLAITTEG